MVDAVYQQMPWYQFITFCWRMRVIHTLSHYPAYKEGAFSDTCILEQEKTKTCGHAANVNLHTSYNFRQKCINTILFICNNVLLLQVAQYTQRPYSSVDAVNSSDEEDALDYKTRRVRSTDNSPNVHDHRRTLTAADFQKKHFDFLAPSGSKPGVSKVVFNSPELTRRRRARSRDRASSRAAANLSRNQWVSRYRPGVPIPTESARESIMQAELRHREKEFCTYRELRCAGSILIVFW